MIYENHFFEAPVQVNPTTQQPIQPPLESRGNKYLPGGLQEIQIGTGNTVFHVNKDGLWLGAPKFNDAPFSVSIRGVPKFSATPSTGWNPTNVTPDKAFDANATTLDEVADIVGTLIFRLIAVGIIAA